MSDYRLKFVRLVRALAFTIGGGALLWMGMEGLYRLPLVGYGIGLLYLGIGAFFWFRWLFT